MVSLLTDPEGFLCTMYDIWPNCSSAKGKTVWGVQARHFPLSHQSMLPTWHLASGTALCNPIRRVQVYRTYPVSMK